MDIKGTLHKVGDVLNPFDDLKAWVEKRLAIAEVKIKMACLQLVKRVLDGGIDAEVESLGRELQELESK